MSDLAPLRRGFFTLFRVLATNRQPAPLSCRVRWTRTVGNPGGGRKSLAFLAGLFLSKSPRSAKPISRLDVQSAGLPPV
jgi:hypothetical protein